MEKICISSGSDKDWRCIFRSVFLAAVWSAASRGRKAETGAPGQAAAVVQGAMMETIPVLFPGLIPVLLNNLNDLLC